MIREERNTFRLTGETARRFSKLAKNPDPETARRRDAFLREIDRTIMVTPIEGGHRITLINRNGENERTSGDRHVD